MKTIKLMMALMMCFVTTLSIGQTDTISYNQIKKSEKRIKGNFETYTSKDGFSYSVGDTIQFGTPSGTNGKFVYIQKMDITGTVYIVGPEAVNTYAVIKKIYVGGTKRSGWKITIQTKGFTVVDNYFLYLEDAIANGEIKSNGMTSDEALSELKKWKDKLDLGLITQEEFDAKKEELSKYIK